MKENTGPVHAAGQRAQQRIDMLQKRGAKETRNMQQTYNFMDQGPSHSGKITVQKTLVEKPYVDEDCQKRRSDLTVFEQEYMRTWRQTQQYQPVLSNKKN